MNNKTEELKEEIEFLEWLLAGKGYTKEYYIMSLRNRLKKLKQKIKENGR